MAAKMQWHRTSWMIVGLAACGGGATGGGPGGAEPKAPGPAEPRPTVEVTVDATPLIITSVIALHGAQDKYKLILARGALGCEDGRIAGGEDVSFEVSPHLRPDGSLGWARTQVSYQTPRRGYSESGVGVFQPIADDIVAAPGRVRVPIDFAGALGEREIVIRGTVDAAICEEQRSTKPAKPAQPAVIDIAGRRVPIVGAAIAPAGAYWGEGAWNLMLSSEDSLWCSSQDGQLMTSSNGLRLELLFSKGADAPHRAELGGFWLRDSLTSANGPLPVTLTPRAPALVGTTVEIAIGGATMMFGDYPVTVSGTVQALVCNPAAAKPAP